MKNVMTLLGGVFAVALLTASSCCDFCCKSKCAPKTEVVEHANVDDIENTASESAAVDMHAEDSMVDAK